MNRLLLLLCTFLCNVTVAAQAPRMEISEFYFDFVDIDYNTPAFTLKEGQILRIWDDKVTRKKLLRYSSVYKVYLGEKTIGVDLISDNIIGITSIFEGCQTNFSTIRTDIPMIHWELKKIKYPKKKGKLVLYFEKKSEKYE